MTQPWPIITLIRNEEIPDGVFGEMRIPGYEWPEHRPERIFHTVEDDWRDNKTNISCIPPGTYTLMRTTFFKRGYETFEITKVPQRKRCLFHPANTEEDVEGCIGLGLRRGTIEVARDEDTGKLNVIKQSVVASKPAFDLFMNRMTPYDTATLVVMWSPALAKKE